MPNYVRNIVKFKGTPTQIAQIKEYMQTEENKFDFNKVFPLPKDLNLPSGSDEDIAIPCAKARRKGKTTCESYENISWAQKKTFEEWAELGELYLINLEKYGATTWYDWCCNHWGTKWNAMDVVWNDNTVQFDTAWETPKPIFKKLSRLFPDISFEVSYADEDIGNNCGMMEWNESGFRETYYNDSVSFACEVWNLDPEDYLEEVEDGAETCY